MAENPKIKEKPALAEWNEPHFVAEIVEATRKHPLLKSRLPGSINLEGGKLAAIFDDLISQTLADPYKRERLRYALVDFEGKLRIPKKISLGVEDRVEVAIIRKTINRLFEPQYKQTEQVAFTMHTHGVIEAPPSPQDLVAVLRAPEEGGEQATFILTENIRLLIVRTLQTPELEHDQIKAYISAWADRLRVESKKISENFLLLKETKNKQVFQLQYTMLEEACKNNNLVIYTSYNGTNKFSQPGESSPAVKS